MRCRVRTRFRLSAMEEKKPYRVFVIDEHGTRTEMPDLIVASGADDIRAAMQKTVANLGPDASTASEIHD